MLVFRKTILDFIFPQLYRIFFEYFTLVHISPCKAQLLSFGHKCPIQRELEPLWFMNLALDFHFQTREGDGIHVQQAGRGRPGSRGPWRPLQFLHFQSETQDSIGRVWAEDWVREDLWSPFKPLMKKRDNVPQCRLDHHWFPWPTRFFLETPVDCTALQILQGKMEHGATSAVQVAHTDRAGGQHLLCVCLDSVCPHEQKKGNCCLWWSFPSYILC